MPSDPPRFDPPRSDPQRSEQPVYRPSRGVDPATKRLAVIAGGIGVVLAALIGGWSLTNRVSGGIPVIEPPSGPERVKPANPGGLQLLGAEPPPATDASGTAQLAPGPERPDPAALQAELQQAHAKQAPVSPAPVSPATQTAAAPSDHSTIGHVEVQIAALDSEAAAHAEWSRLSQRYPALFGDRTPLIVQAARDGKTFYRLRTGGFSTVAAATDFCAHSRAAGTACTIAAF